MSTITFDEMQSAKNAWLSSINDGSSEKKQHALSKIYDDTVKIHLYTISSESPLSELDISSMDSKEIITLLETELIRKKNKIKLLDAIYSIHGCDTYEELFRDKIPGLRFACEGIEYAIQILTQYYVGFNQKVFGSKSNTEDECSKEEYDDDDDEYSSMPALISVDSYENEN